MSGSHFNHVWTECIDWGNLGVGVLFPSARAAPPADAAPCCAYLGIHYRSLAMVRFRRYGRSMARARGEYRSAGLLSGIITRQTYAEGVLLESSNARPGRRSTVPS